MNTSKFSALVTQEQVSLLGSRLLNLLNLLNLLPLADVIKRVATQKHLLLLMLNNLKITFVDLRNSIAVGLRFPQSPSNRFIFIAFFLLYSTVCAVYELSILWFVLVFVLLSVFFVFNLVSLRQILILSVLAFCSYGYGRVFVSQPGENDISQYNKETIVFQGKVLESKETAFGNSCILECSRLIYPARKNIEGRVLLKLLSAGKAEDKPGVPEQNNLPVLSKSPSNLFVEGQALEVKGCLRNLKPTIEPWQMNYSDYLKRRHVFAQAYVTTANIRCMEVDTTNGADAVIVRVRQKIVALNKQSLGEEHGALMSAIVLGDKAVTVPESISNQFRQVGLSHLLAASGFNLTIIIGFSQWLCRLFFVPVFIAQTASLVSIVVFVALAGSSASVIRAAIMGVLLIGVAATNGRVHLPAALFLALILTIAWSPDSIKDIGLQFSYLATFGIVYGAKILASNLLDLFSTVKSHSVVKPVSWLCLKLSVLQPCCLLISQKLGIIFLETMAVVLAAQFAVFPIQLYYFWQCGLMFLPANLIASPIIPFVTVIGFIAALLEVLPWPFFDTCTKALLSIAHYPLVFLTWVVRFLCGFRWAVVAPGCPSLGAMTVYYLSLVILYLCFSGHFQVIRRFRFLSLVLFVSAFLFLFSGGRQLELPKLVVLPDCIAVVEKNGQAQFWGNSANYQFRRLIFYYGIHQLQKTKNNLLCNRGKFSILVLDDLIVEKFKVRPDWIILSSQYLQALDDLGQSSPASLDEQMAALGKLLSCPPSCRVILCVDPRHRLKFTAWVEYNIRQTVGNRLLVQKGNEPRVIDLLKVSSIKDL